MFRREVRTASLAGLTREIQARRTMVHDAVAREIQHGPDSRSRTEASRIYQVFASFQGDTDMADEARYLQS